MKKFRNVRPFLCGMLSTVLLMGLVGTAVAANLVNKELYYNDIKVRLNGKTLNPTDANGNKVEPFVIDGTTYLPIRAVGEALGLNVSWDGATSTVILGNDQEMGQPAKWLGEMETFTGTAQEYKIERDGHYEGLFTANDGSTYDRCYLSSNGNSSSNSVSYLLKGQYSRFTGTFYLTMDNKDGPRLPEGSGRAEAYFEVFLDGKLTYTSKTMKSGALPDTFEVDVSNAYEMEIVFYPMWETYYAGSWHTGIYPQYTPIANAALWTD